jgi:prevent-host-death family protein
MQIIGIRELKAGLSQHLRRAERGSRVTITDRGKPIAVLGPAEPVAEPAWVRRLVAEGKASWGGGKPVGLHPRIPARGKPASEMILEDRR